MDIYIVDAFTTKPYTGNPAAVCILPSEKPEDWMQSVAAEMNLSETAFLIKNRDGYLLRWFTPTSEVDLCGHATLASAHILWEQQITQDQQIKFFTKSGLLTARKEDWIQMSFPLEPDKETTPPDVLLKALNISLVYVGKNRMDYIVEVENEAVLAALQPNFEVLKQLPSRGLIVTAPSAARDVDFVSRCFFPAYGINEDPVTGSAHCCLGPYWAEKLGKGKLVAKQISSRQGLLKLEVGKDRIIICGQAITTLEGQLCDKT